MAFRISHKFLYGALSKMVTMRMSDKKNIEKLSHLFGYYWRLIQANIELKVEIEANQTVIAIDQPSSIAHPADCDAVFSCQ